MIHLATEYIVDRLNGYLNLRSPSLTPQQVVRESLFDLDGNPNTGARDVVVVSVVNVAEDKVYHDLDRFVRQPDGSSERIKPDVKVNVFLLFTANLSDYDESLKALSNVVSFFQHQNSFDYATIPSLSDREGRLVFELQTLTFEQQNHLWGALGAKYMPSVLYKMGIASIRDERVEEIAPPVEDILINEP